MKDGFERTFVVDVPRAEAWKVLTAEDGFLPAWETPIDEVVVDEERSLRARKAAMPCEGTEIVITLEDEGSGTRVRVVQSGFGADFEGALESLSVGMDVIVADLALLIERGVRGMRHARPWSGIGASWRQVAAGLEITNVRDGFASRAGIVPGDILLTFAGAPIYDERDIQALLRSVRTGDTVKAAWVHDRERRSATATID